MDINSLKEVMVGDNDSPITMEFSNLKNEYLHFHSEAELLFVLRGQMECRIHHQNYVLTTGDVLFVDREDLHAIHSCSEDILFLRTYIDFSRFENLNPNILWMIFVCEKSSHSLENSAYASRVDQLRSLLVHLMQLTMEKNDRDSDKDGNTDSLTENFENFIKFLIHQFRGFFIFNNEFHPSEATASITNIERIERIMKYIDLNMDSRITLDDIAGLEHLNSYYISHLITDALGLSFQSLLNHLRSEAVEKLLIHSFLSLTQISETVGFSSLTYMNKVFLSLHGVTPSVYRKSHKKINREYGIPFSKEEALLLLNSYSTKDVENKMTEEINLGYIIPACQEEHLTFRYSLNLVAYDLEDLVSIQNKLEILRDLAFDSVLLKLEDKEIEISGTSIFHAIQSLQAEGVSFYYANRNVPAKESNLKLYQRLDIALSEGKASESAFLTSPADIVKGVKAGNKIYLPLDISRGGLFCNGIYTFNYIYFKELASSKKMDLINFSDNFIVNKNGKDYFINLANVSSDFSRYFKIKLPASQGSYLLSKSLISESSIEMRLLETARQTSYIKSSVVSDINNFATSPTEIQLITDCENYVISAEVPPNSFMFLRFNEI